MICQEKSVVVEDYQVIHQRKYPHDQYVLRLQAPRCAQLAKPGQFVHLQCDSTLRMRRPYSIMSASRATGEVEILYRVVGRGSRRLSRKRRGDRLSGIGPLGNGFVARSKYPRPLLLGGGIGIPPVFFLAESLRSNQGFSPFAIFASERPFPFSLCESKQTVVGIADEVCTTHAELEALKIPARLCSRRPQSGCFAGFAHELAEVWLQALSAEKRLQVELFACGPRPMLVAVAALARKYALPCCLSLEEYMACALGGCAACAVPVIEAGDIHMRRVCVDGPVFNAASLQL